MITQKRIEEILSLVEEKMEERNYVLLRRVLEMLEVIRAEHPFKKSLERRLQELRERIESL